jgi:hypothetical protein
MDKLWLPEGHHWGLIIEHQEAPITGRLDRSAGPKLCWHTAEMHGADATAKVLRAKGDEVHFVIAPSAGDSKVIQQLPLDSIGRGLEHPSGTPITNAANAIQVEIADFAKDAHSWPHYYYRDLAALACLVQHRVPIPRKAPHHFGLHATRFTANGWIHAEGHVGHEHAPNQPSGHWDPGALNWPLLAGYMLLVEHQYK